MSEERINALLQFGGGLLVFIAALTPAIRHILKKASEEPAKERIKQMARPLVRIVLILTGFYFYFFGDIRIAGTLIFISALDTVISFTQLESPPTRKEIVFDVVLPVLIFLLIII
ncbi:hypothetical protein DDZ13_14885 [Coraliomargarita sinensis]|uniref:Uncharacterized protein n=1 Tax=Coraliomargarita sinensis TaxID=2174842 RepID=A0A317ZDT9_9BACT|nr:hypothetical protein [Coraliomargarita sinensis]PXA02872.1 hypothetical protein DDZ13_14885 [Coraliomargarita sinensis]